jgi:hypothetical protein
MTNPTLRQLIAGATPGPWQALYMGSSDWGVHATKENDALVYSAGDVGRSQAEANAQLIARMASPEVALKVLEALEFYADKKNHVTTSTGFAVQYDPKPSAIHTDYGDRARSLLSLLNALTPEDAP